MEGYYLKDPLQKIVDKCNEVCKTCNKKETPDNTNCNSCKNEKYLYLGNCVNSCDNGFEIDEDGNKICKCPPECKACNKESSKNKLYIACNDGFYKKINDEANKSLIISNATKTLKSII